ncbi:MAG: dihydrodipicolinate reductase C-terminal domain-containing protein [Acidobacteriota bacterium]
MGKLIRARAEEKGHEIAVVLDSSDAAMPADRSASKLASCDAAIDFTAAEAVPRNVEACMIAGIPLVEGTTGWNAERDEIERIVRNGDGAMVFGANFSIGVNIFYRIADYAAVLISKFPEYEAFIEEQHHSRKKDSPSGTALKLQEILSGHSQRDIPVTSTRAGNIPGTHRVGFDGPADQILLKHTARSREGFAAGAILAAEWVIGRRGIFEFSDVIDEVGQYRLR